MKLVDFVFPGGNGILCRQHSATVKQEPDGTWSIYGFKEDGSEVLCFGKQSSFERAMRIADDLNMIED